MASTVLPTIKISQSKPAALGNNINLTIRAYLNFISKYEAINMRKAVRE